VDTHKLDIGSYNLRAGFSGGEAPNVTFTSVCGYPKYRASVNLTMGDIIKDKYIGEEAQAKRSVLFLKYVLENGIVTNWDNWESIIHDTFYNRLHTAPEEHPVLMTEPPC
jgi:actin